ncbi:MAG: hypothetical protein Q9160_004770 [Pyrenula sp. 1 TL-2023]
MKPLSLRPYLPTAALRRRSPRSTPRFFIPHLSGASRSYAVQAPGAPTLEVFNQRKKFLQKERAAAVPESSRRTDYLRNELASRLCDRLLDISRSFPNIIDLGANSCNIAKVIASSDDLRGRINNVICADTPPSLLYRDPLPANTESLQFQQEILPSLETILPYESNTFDAVVSSLSLHWANDLPNLLRNVNNILKPDAPFIGAMLGGDTLFELRSSLQLADLERLGGVTPHVSPLADIRDVGGLLTKAGFKLLTVDVDDIIVDYPDTFALMQDLQSMGENNATLMNADSPGLSRDVLLANEAIYREMYTKDGQGAVEPKEGKAEEAVADSIPATFRVIYMIGWKEGTEQEQPLARGSGEVNLKDMLGGGDFEKN